MLARRMIQCKEVSMGNSWLITLRISAERLGLSRIDRTLRQQSISLKCSVFTQLSRKLEIRTGFIRRMSSSGSMPSYEERMEMFELDSKEDIAEVAKDPKCVFIDLRRDEELEENGSLTTYQCVHAPCNMNDFSSIKNTVLEPSNPMHISDKTTPIILFCGIGGRATIVQKLLEERGYVYVYNAGGFHDLDHVK